MALPQHLRDSFSPDEIEFIASDEPITIIPSHRLLNIHRYLLASTPTGPLRPPLRAEVPLWLALTLRKRRKCQIVPPDWLNADHLRSVLDEELKDEERFATLPFHYMETAALLLEVAAEDIPRSDLVRTLLKDLREARQVKTRDGFQAIRVNYLQVGNGFFFVTWLISDGQSFPHGGQRNPTIFYACFQ